MSQSNASGCFKYGCIGCVSVLAVAFGLVFLVSALRFATDEEPRPERSTSEQTLPPAPPRHAGTDRPAPDRPVDVELAPGTAPPDAVAGTLVLDLSMGDFTVRPGPPDEPLRVEADYDAAGFELEETYTEGDDGSWTYEVGFGGRGGFLGTLLGGGGNVHNEVTVIVPRGRALNLVANVSLGESKLDLTGLWLRDVYLELRTGDHFVEIREPQPQPGGAFDVRSSMGEIELRGLGQVSPRRLEVRHGMGELLLDLTGRWRRDAEVEVSFSMGDCRIWLPDDARVDLVRSSVSMGEASTDLPDGDALPADAPTLTLAASGSMGSLRVER